MALHPSDDLTHDVSSDRMTFAVLVGGDRVLHELPDAAMALLLPQNRECAESCSKQHSRGFIHSGHSALSRAGLGSLCIRVFPAKSRHTCTGALRVSTGLGAASVAKIFSPIGVEFAMRTQPRSVRRRRFVPAAEKIKRLFWRAEMPFYALFFAHRPAASGRIPPMPRWGQQFLLLEIYSMQRTHLLGEEMSKYRERTLGRFATAIEDGYGGKRTRRGRNGSLDGVGRGAWCVGRVE